jgi:predicted enzyme related to lactoylglutathione lyase
MDNMPSVWNSYIAVDDPGAVMAKAEAAGGQVVMPPMDVFTSGSMAVLADPAGAMFSVWRAGDHIGAEIANEANTWSWNELLSRDIDASKAFYAEVFGWEYDEQDMGPQTGIYSVIRGGESGGLGGLMAMPEQVPEMVPSHWSVYFTVDDLAAAQERVTANGGMTVMEPMEMPGIGTMATMHDPTGGTFTLMQPAPQG